jgi:hypothetical protein
MAEVFWLVSYPKSGNTWMRILLANIRAGAAVDPNTLSQRDLAASFSRVLFDQFCGLKSSTLTPVLIDRLRPAVYRRMAAEMPVPQVLKVHDAWHLTDRGEPAFPSEITTGVIYLVRNVLDVAPSAADHWGVDCAEAASRLCDSAFALGRPDGLLPGLNQPLGNWSGHIASWLDDSGLRRIVVRYEDMIADTADALAKVLDFLGWSTSAGAIAAAVEAASFARLQSFERDTGFCERSPMARSRFFRRGRAGGWRNELTPEQVCRLSKSHAAMMRRFDYLDQQGEPK